MKGQDYHNMISKRKAEEKIVSLLKKGGYYTTWGLYNFSEFSLSYDEFKKYIRSLQEKYSQIRAMTLHNVKNKRFFKNKNIRSSNAKIWWWDEEASEK